MQTHITQLTSCIACGNEHLELVLDLHDQPLANKFHKPEDILEKYPLKVNHCEKCHHLQLSHVVDPKLIYTEYPYTTGVSKTYHDYMNWYANFVNNYVSTGEIIVDVGCNDGSQLDAFKQLGWQTIGVDPALNHFQTSSLNHRVICDFWNEDVATQIGKADIISNQNAFAHLPDPLRFLKTASKILSDDGYIFISTSQADMVVNGEFDTIYHEHISFYNAYSMRALVERAGLFLVDVFKTPIHGTSYVFVVSKRDLNYIEVSAFIERERQIITTEAIHKWANNVQQFVVDFNGVLDYYQSTGYQLVGFGAAAKGNTLLNFTGAVLDFIIDETPTKQGLLTPGSNISICGIETLQSMSPNKALFVPLAWNFFDEIKEKIIMNRDVVNDLFLKYFPKIEISLNKPLSS